MTETSNTVPDLEDRFLEPEGWRWHSFIREGREIRFGSIFPKDSIPDAVVICLPGLGEFSEKYFETARTCLDKNLAFWIMDWMGQGRSGRYLKNPQKRHATSFQDDVDDLHYFIMEYVKHACVHPDVGRIPITMLAHSMGGNIGLHYLHQHPDMFECAAFTAPLFGLKATDKIPLPCLLPISALLRVLMPKKYVGKGSDWDQAMRPFDGPDALSTDPVRVQVHTQWFESDQELQVGSPTYKWLHAALVSCLRASRKSLLKHIQKACLISLAGKEQLVDNIKAHKIAAALPHCKLQELSESHHEILMETDNIRDQFFQEFYALIKENIIDRPETLKPF